MQILSINDKSRSAVFIRNNEFSISKVTKISKFMFKAKPQTTEIEIIFLAMKKIMIDIILNLKGKFPKIDLEIKVITSRVYNIIQIMKISGTAINIRKGMKDIKSQPKMEEEVENKATTTETLEPIRPNKEVISILINLKEIQWLIIKPMNKEIDNQILNSAPTIIKLLLMSPDYSPIQLKVNNSFRQIKR